MKYNFSERTKVISKKQQEFIYFKDKVKSLMEEGKTIYDFSIGDPKEPKDPIIAKNIKKAVKKYEKSGYPQFGGEKIFLEACAEYMKKRFNIDFDPYTEICITNGVKTALDYFTATIIENGDMAICPVPSYPPYISNTKDYGGDVYLLPMIEENNFLLDFNTVPKNILNKTKIIFLNYPNSPTGAVANIDYYKKITKWAEDNNIIIASDEGSYIDIYYDINDKPISIFNGKDNKNGIIAFYSLSKRNNMINDRVGFVCGDKNIINVYKQLQNRKMGGVPPYIQEVATIAIKDKKYHDYLIKQYSQKFDLVVNTLNSIGIKTNKSKGSFYLWIKAPNNMTGKEFAEKLLNIGIAVIDGALISEEVNGIDPALNYIRMALVPLLNDIKKACKIIVNNYDKII